MAAGTINLAQNVPHMFDRDTTIDRVVGVIGASAAFEMKADQERTPTANSPLVFSFSTGVSEVFAVVELGIKFPKGTVVMVTAAQGTTTLVVS